MVPVPTHKSSVHPLLGKTLAAPCTSDNLSSSNCKKSSFSPSPASGCSLAGSYADEKVSRAVGADGTSEARPAAVAAAEGPAGDEEGPAEGRTGESNLAELKSSCEDEGSDGWTGAGEEKRPEKKDMAGEQTLQIGQAGSAKSKDRERCVCTMVAMAWVEREPNFAFAFERHRAAPSGSEVTCTQTEKISPPKEVSSLLLMLLHIHTLQGAYRVYPAKRHV